MLEAKGDRVKDQNFTHVINRPAYNEMVGSLSAFLVSKLDRIQREDSYLYKAARIQMTREQALRDASGYVQSRSKNPELLDRMPLDSPAICLSQLSSR